MKRSSVEKAAMQIITRLEKENRRLQREIVRLRILAGIDVDYGILKIAGKPEDVLSAAMSGKPRRFNSKP